jgi:uncharacterized protein (DUF433 family)
MTTIASPEIPIAGRIEKTPGVCGGDARVAGHRIPVWLLVLKKKMGQSDANILADYPTLTPDDLAACWGYYQKEPLEIEQLIWLNDTVGNVPPGTPVPAAIIIAGTLLGLSDAQVMEAFDEPLTTAHLSAACGVAPGGGCGHSVP